MKYLRAIALFLYCLPLFLQAKETRPSWKDRARVRALHQTDLLLYWGFAKTGQLSVPPSLSKAKPLELNWPELKTFEKKYGYFSLSHPLISKVSSSPHDTELIAHILSAATKAEGDIAALELSIAELLTKGLAYRDLKQGQTLLLPTLIDKKVSLESFTVDCTFNIWQGMPAFGLIPEKEGIPSLLLFRGTDFSFITKRGIASVLSDLDPKGPGLRVFLNAREGIKAWLKKVHAQGKNAKVMGFSLGGALASYTFIDYNKLLSKEKSIAICPPGVSAKVCNAFYNLPKNAQNTFITYINSGDLVSQIGHLFGNVYILSARKPLKPLSAHTALLSARSPLYATPYPTKPKAP